MLVYENPISLLFKLVAKPVRVKNNCVGVLYNIPVCFNVSIHEYFILYRTSLNVIIQKQCTLAIKLTRILNLLNSCEIFGEAISSWR